MYTEEEIGSWPLGKLLDHIVWVHHRYIRETTPVLLEYAERVATHHGDAEPRLVELESVVSQGLTDLLDHCNREERVLFPAIRALADSAFTDDHGLHLFIVRCVDRMQKEHAMSGGELEKIRELTIGYTPPGSACNAYRLLYRKLEEFDADLRQHIHLENDILFPKALGIAESDISLKTV